MAYKQSTIKRLWGASQNQCAAPDCDVEIVDTAQGLVIGHIAHIRAQSQDGPRYDPSLSDNEIDDPANLVLLCPTHHTIVDKKPEDYPPELLQSWKESQLRETPEPGDVPEELLEEWGTGPSNVTVNDGSYVSSVNQLGGQVAHNINNIGPQPREISQQTKRVIAQQLQQVDPLHVDVGALMGDGEAYRLAEQIVEVLEMGGWDPYGVSQIGFSGPVEGIRLRMLNDSYRMRGFGNLLIEAGLDTHATLPDEVDEHTVLVGNNAKPRRR